MSDSSKQDERERSRRMFCKVCIGGMTTLSVASVSYPVATFLVMQPRRVGGDKPLEVPLDQLAVGQAQYAEFRGQQVIVLMREDGPAVLNASCPHLGCNVIWDTAESQFHCPCHGAKFDETGEVLSGPVSAPLKQIPFEVKDGKLIVA